jgi:uncharacterized surface protein with fasciclin (FAS1) repeats
VDRTFTEGWLTIFPLISRTNLLMNKLHNLVLGTTVALGALGAQGTALAASKDIVDTAVAAGSFKTLVTALQAADLVDTLKGPGPFTVFAPTDDAFAKIPKADLDALLKDKKALTTVLTYHVVAGKVMAADVVKLTQANTLEGSTVKITVMGGKVMVNNANVTATDIVASNGVIHVIDTVLMPPKN